MSLIKKDVWDSYNLSCSVDDEGGVYPKVVLVSRLVELKKEFKDKYGSKYPPELNSSRHSLFIELLDEVFPDEVLKCL